MATSKAKAQVKKEDKTKTTGKEKKSTAAAVSGKTREVSTRKSAVGEDKIRAKAQEIYNNRLTRGEQGTAEGDWLKAEKLLTGKKK